MVRIGDVATFPDAKPDKEQAKKVLEEAAEVFGAWQAYDNRPWSIYRTERLKSECADVVQAVANMLAAIGVEDFTEYMQACEARNRERGRL
jgi:NTP pyrophosphatase (non-canonical NTP hydrolase)